MFDTGTLDGFKVQSTVGCYPELFSSVFRGASAYGVRKQFINNFDFPLGPVFAGNNNIILAYKVIIVTYLLNDFSIMEMSGIKSNLNNGDLRIPLYATTHSQFFIRYRAINTWIGLSCDLRLSSSPSTLKNKLRLLYLSLT